MGSWLTTTIAFTFIAAMVLVWVLMLVAAIRNETGWRRIAWVFTILFLSLPGALIYFVYWTMLRNAFTKPTLIQTAIAAGARSATRARAS
ncbi:MAG: hypothetical protein ABI583_01455 [Betaproteobacteria bacterium]